MAEPKGPAYHQNLGAAPRTLLFLRPKGAIYQKRFGTRPNPTLRADGHFRAFSGLFGRARFERYSAPVSGLFGCLFGLLSRACSRPFPAFFQRFSRFLDRFIAFFLHFSRFSDIFGIVSSYFLLLLFCSSLRMLNCIWFCLFWRVFLIFF